MLNPYSRDLCDNYYPEKSWTCTHKCRLELSSIIVTISIHWILYPTIFIEIMRRPQNYHVKYFSYISSSTLYTKILYRWHFCLKVNAKKVQGEWIWGFIEPGEEVRYCLSFGIWLTNFDTLQTSFRWRFNQFHHLCTTAVYFIYTNLHYRATRVTNAILYISFIQGIHNSNKKASLSNARVIRYIACSSRKNRGVTLFRSNLTHCSNTFYIQLSMSRATLVVKLVRDFHRRIIFELSNKTIPSIINAC